MRKLLTSRINECNATNNFPESMAIETDKYFKHFCKTYCLLLNKYFNAKKLSYS